MHHGPVLISVPSFGDTYWNRKSGKLTQGKKPSGNHAMVIIGWRDNNELIIQNSWGESWGDKGRAYLTYGEYDINEMWAIVDANTAQLIKERAIKEHKHQYDEWFIESEPTCTTTGLRKRVCKNTSLVDCEEYEVQLIGMLGHKYNEDWIEGNPLTFIGKRVFTRKCERCGKTETKYKKDWTVSIWYKIIQSILNIFRRGTK